jgi:hypothetical protein
MARKAENKWFLFAILFWLYSLPILGNTNYMISVPFLGIDLQPSRVLFLFLSGVVLFYLIRLKLTGKSILDSKLHQLQAYEIWMIAYVGFAVLSLMINMNELGLRVLIVQTIKLSTFLLLYFFARECLTFHDFYILVKAFVFFGLLSTVVGIYQFFVDPYFFRIGSIYPAFGSYFRSNGFLSAEYDQGIFLIMIFIIGMTTLREKWIRVLMVILIPFGVFLTMHRASWIIFSIIFGIILLKEMHKQYLLLFSSCIGVLLLLLVMNIPLAKGSSGSFLDQLVKERVTADTVGIRLDYNRFAMEIIRKFPFGIGEYVSNQYIQEAYTRSMGFSSGRPLVIHNGFLSAGVKNGLLGLVLFSLFLFTSILSYFKYFLLDGKYWYSPLMIMLIFVLINLSNDFSFLGTEIYLMVATIIGGYIAASGSNPIGNRGSQPLAQD